MKKKNNELEIWINYNETKIELLKEKLNKKCKEVEELENINYNLKLEIDLLKAYKLKRKRLIQRQNKFCKLRKKLKSIKKEKEIIEEKDIIIEYFLNPKNYQ